MRRQSTLQAGVALQAVKEKQDESNTDSSSNSFKTDCELDSNGIEKISEEKSDEGQSKERSAQHNSQNSSSRTPSSKSPSLQARRQPVKRASAQQEAKPSLSLSKALVKRVSAKIGGSTAWKLSDSGSECLTDNEEQEENDDDDGNSFLDNMLLN